MNVTSVLKQCFAIAVAENIDVLHGDVLDAGCGVSPYERLKTDAITSWTGVDERPVGDIEADIMMLPEEMYDSYDSILCVDVLHEVIDPHSTFESFKRVLRNKGHLLVIARDCTREPEGGFFGMHSDGLQMLCEVHGLVVETVALGGKVWHEEYANLRQSAGGMSLPPEVEGFFAELDDRLYPQVSIVIARKEAKDGKEGPS